MGDFGAWDPQIWSISNTHHSQKTDDDVVVFFFFLSLFFLAGLGLQLQCNLDTMLLCFFRALFWEGRTDRGVCFSWRKMALIALAQLAQGCLCLAVFFLFSLEKDHTHTFCLAGAFVFFFKMDRMHFVFVFWKGILWKLIKYGSKMMLKLK